MDGQLLTKEQINEFLTLLINATNEDRVEWIETNRGYECIIGEHFQLIEISKTIQIQESFFSYKEASTTIALTTKNIELKVVEYNKSKKNKQQKVNNKIIENAFDAQLLISLLNIINEKHKIKVVDSFEKMCSSLKGNNLKTVAQPINHNGDL
jgi:hypothetical protein